MKKIHKILWGVCFLALGGIILLNLFGIIHVNLFFKGWPTLIFMVPAAIEILNPSNDKDDRILYFFVVYISANILLIIRNIASIKQCFAFAFAVIVILTGCEILNKTLRIQKRIKIWLKMYKRAKKKKQERRLELKGNKIRVR